MFLKSVELFGFKSFADRTRFDFADGITSLLGPNGSGKSNVVDSIKWVLGTQSLNAIRAGKREDVIFNGTDNRKPMQMCEVILTLNNENNLLNTDLTEVEIKRRMKRDGENQYFINRQPVLQRQVKDLFVDTGVGKAAYSILEQGKIDQILSLKPEDRRYIFEEAAGISRYKAQSEEASRKLERTDENLRQVENILHEVEKTYNSRKGQMEKVLRYKELIGKKESLSIELELSYVQSLTSFMKMQEEELKKKKTELEELESFLNSGRSDMEDQNRIIENLRNEREEINNNINRTEEQVNSSNVQINLLNERLSDIQSRTNEARFKARQVQDKLEKDKELYEERKHALDTMKENIRISAHSINKLSDEIESLKANVTSNQDLISKLSAETDALALRRNDIAQEISEIAGNIADRLQANISGGSYSTAVRQKAEKDVISQINKIGTQLRERCSFLSSLTDVDFDSDIFKTEVEKTEEEISDSVFELKGLFQEYTGTVPSFLDEFVSPEGSLSKKAELDKELSQSFSKENENREKITELEYESTRLSNMIILKESDLNDARIEEAKFRTHIEVVTQQLSEMLTNLQQSEFDFSDASHSIESELAKEGEITQSIEDAKLKKKALLERIESFKIDMAEKNRAIEEANEVLSSSNEKFREQFDRKQTLSTEIATSEANISNLNSQIEKIHTDFFDETGKSLKEFEDHTVTADVNDLKSELEAVKKSIQNLGYINQMAEEEYEEAKKNYEFYKKNLDDLNKAKSDLEGIISDIKTRSEELFIETYDQISKAFTTMFRTLFNGGHAELSLSDEEDVLHSGIEILAQPPGKKLTHLPLLSGGEKSMTAVALLFATYLVKPSPFCILDEIDAALDARNIGAFMKALEQFGDKSQFIIITHNKNTVLGSDSLLGVTQEELGVSKSISYKLESDKDISESEETLKG
ncbi:MAG: AAA family ATPase [Sphaerochaetaceae bacterium]|nr:AAA family ATPase [Sphaerochaetaceae bacterium]